MTTNNDEPVCECGCPLTRHVRFINGVLACAAGCPNSCNQFTDARLAALRAEIARLTPTKTDKLPTKAGWYWRVNDEIGEWEMIHVRADLDGNLYTESRDDDGTVVIDLALRGKWWSAEPIPEMVVPDEKGGEG